MEKAKKLPRTPNDLLSVLVGVSLVIVLEVLVLCYVVADVAVFAYRRRHTAFGYIKTLASFVGFICYAIVMLVFIIPSDALFGGRAQSSDDRGRPVGGGGIGGGIDPAIGGRFIFFMIAILLIFLLGGVAAHGFISLINARTATIYNLLSE